jgi:hypothetical protein
MRGRVFRRAKARWRLPAKHGHPKPINAKTRGPLVFLASARSQFDQLVTQTELVDELAVCRDVRRFEVLQETAASANHLQETLPAVVVFRVRAEVIVEVIDPVREHRDLHFRGSGVRFVPLVLLQGGGLRKSHVFLPELNASIVL